MTTQQYELTEDELHFYSRQILLDAWDLDAQQALKNKQILIVGAGGIGCTTAMLLARAGVGRMSIIDPDHVEISNLQRQMAFDLQDIGQPKAQALAQRLRSINPHIIVDAYVAALNEQNAQDMIRHQDLVLDGCDQFSIRYLVNQVCVTNQVPLISASAMGLEGQLFMMLPSSNCYACIFPPEDAADEHLRCAHSGVLSTTPNIMASLQAHHALLYLGLGQTPLSGKLLLWNGISMQQRILNVDKDENCPCCQTVNSLSMH